MTREFRVNLISFAFMLALVVPVHAQPGQSKPQPQQTMSGSDMQTMMNQCAQMRRRMKPGSSMSADMQRMMARCDQMDAQMNNPTGNPSGPRPRTR